ncbi:MAG: cupin-like domain-containing protein [Legionellales bacterium]|jgi:hypothetical protein
MIHPHIKEMPLIASCDTLVEKDFLARFGKPNIPFLLKGGVADTVAMQKWDWDFFANTYGDREIIVYRTSNRNKFQKMSFKSYIDYIQTTKDNDPLYLLDWFIDKNCPELHKDYAVPSYFDSWIDNFVDISKFLSFYIGPKNSASKLHIDILSTSAWNAVFRGQKLWVFYPPEQSALIYNGKVNPFKPDYEKYPLYKQAQGVYAIQGAGDLIFTPSNWWHGVYNMENTISLTDNFINQSNIKQFIKSFIPSTIHLIKRTWKRRHQQYN